MTEIKQDNIEKRSINFGIPNTEGIHHLADEVKEKDHASLADRGINFGVPDTQKLHHIVEEVKEKDHASIEERSINFGEADARLLQIKEIRKRSKELIETKIQELSLNKEVVKDLSSFNRAYRRRERELPNRIEAINEWYKENREADPNFYEYIEVAGDTNRYLTEKKAKYKDLERVYNGILKLGNTISNRAIENGIVEKNDPLYGMINEATEKAISGEIMYSSTPFINKNIAGVAEYISKSKRDNIEVELSEEEFQKLSFLEKLGHVIELGVSLNRKKVFNTIKNWYEHEENTIEKPIIKTK